MEGGTGEDNYEDLEELKLPFSFAEANLECSLPFKRTRPRRYRELLDVLEGYKAQTKKARLDATAKMDDFRALEAKDSDNEIYHDATLVALINHHRKRAFTESNIGSDSEAILNHPQWSLPDAAVEA